MSYRFPAAVPQAMARSRDVSLACPPALDKSGNPITDQRDRLAWLRCAVEMGKAYLQQQRSWEDLDRAIDIIAGITRERVDPRLSDISVNLIKRDVREITEVLSDIRQFYGVQTDNSEFDHQVEIQNKLSSAWAQNIGIDRYMKKALQYASCLCNGYFRPYWNPNKYSKGRGDIDLDVYGGRDVLPIHLPRSHDLQQAHAVIICHQMPLWEARYRWPQWADQLKPAMDSAWHGWGPSNTSTLGNRIFNFFQGKSPDAGKESERTPWPVVEVYYCYILDHSVNESGHPIAMGRPGSSWSYTVPSFDAKTPEASYLYPLRRLMCATADVILEDDTARDWHGMAPAIKFSLDEWAWDFLGYSIVRDTYKVQQSLDSLRRAVNDSANVRLQPPYLYDKNIISPTDAATFNPRIPGGRMMADLRAGIEPIKFPIPTNIQDVQQWIPNYITYLEQMQHHLTGVADVRSMSQASQLPASDTLEKLLEMAGPLVRGMSRSIEQPMNQLGQMNIGNFVQYYTAERRIKMLGTDGVTPEDFDYEPGSMVPAGEGSRASRGRSFIQNFFYQITPGSLHQLRQSSTKLLYLQLAQRGMPIDPETLMKAMDVPNFGRIEGSTVLDKWLNWQKQMRNVGLETQALQMLVQMMMTQMAQGGTPEGQMANIIQQLGPALQGLANAGGAPKQPEGRPNTFAKMPEIEVKGDGRSTISTS